MATERGKIGRLSFDVREQINRMIRDNKTHDDILGYLAGKGITEVTPQNISAWKEFGYQKWLRQQERIDEMGNRVDFARSIVAKARESGEDPSAMVSDTASQLAVDTMLAVLEDFDPATLRGALAEKPEKFLDMVWALSAIRKGDQAGILLRQKVDEYQRKIKQLEAIVDEHGVATKDDLKSVFAESYGA